MIRPARRLRLRCRPRPPVVAALALAAAAACGGPAADPTVAGSWRAEFAAGTGELELSPIRSGRVGGSLRIEQALWSVTGTTGPGAAARFELHVLPVRNEEALFAALALTVTGETGAAPPAVRPGLRPAHAEDRVIFRGEVSADGRSAAGTVTSVRSINGSGFELRR